MKKIALFGGAFDPPHLGHTAIIQSLLKIETIGKIVITPTGPRGDKEYHTSLEQRKTMIEIWKNTLTGEETSKIVLDFDVFYGIVSEGTYDHEYYFGKKYHTEHVIHVFGSDTLSSMSSWEPHGEKVAQDFEKIIFERKGYSLDTSGVAHATFLENLTLPEISSTEIRAGKKGFLSQAVWEYIERNKLYQL